MVFNKAKFTHYPCTFPGLMGRPHVGEEAECSQISLPWTACHQFQATSPEQCQVSIATEQLQKDILFMALIMESRENFGVPFPETKMHLQNVFEIYYCICFFSYHILWTTLIKFKMSLYKSRIISVVIYWAGMFCTVLKIENIGWQCCWS